VQSALNVSGEKIDVGRFAQQMSGIWRFRLPEIGFD